MENKDLLWTDYNIAWPNHDYIYFDKKLSIDCLDILSALLHAESAEVAQIINEEDYGVYYHKNKNTLECWNCSIILHYEESVKKVKLGGKIYA